MIALDTSAIICLIERVESAHGTLVDLIDRHHRRSIVSMVALAECLVPFMISGDHERLRNYDEFWRSPDVTMHPVTIAIATKAAELRAAFRLKTPDAIHLATAIEFGAEAFATTDWKDFAPCVGEVPITIELVARYPHQQPPP